MRVVVAGATGNIGTALVRALTANGHAVVGIARRVPAGGATEAHIRWLSADVSTDSGVDTLRHALAHADAYVHLVWPLQPMRRPGYLHQAGPETMLACMRAALAAGIERIVHLSSVAAYQAAPHSLRIDEGWPLAGVAGSTYARHKAEGEVRLLQEFTARGTTDRLAVMRPCLVAAREAGGSMMRAGTPALLPGAVLRHLPVVPVARGFALQLVHAADVASAVVEVLERRACGAFNLAGDGVVDGPAIAGALGARSVPVPDGLLRTTAAAAWRLHLQPVDPTWIDMASRAPHMSTAKAHRELDWRPRHDAHHVLRELVSGMADGAGVGTPSLRPRTLRDQLRTLGRRGPVSRRPAN